jgi:hypothetical protein
MGRRTIAPDLTAFVEGALYMDGKGARAVRRQLRDLKAVARACEDETASDRGCQAKPMRERCPMCRALARLRRASRKREGR